MMRGRKLSIAWLVIFLYCHGLGAQDNRTQYPPGLKNAYFGVNIGYIRYPFSSTQLEPGFLAQSVSIPHLAVRLVLYGVPINKYLSAKVTYMRPVNWVVYRNINGDHIDHTVWMNIAGLTMNGRFPLNNKLFFSGEAGLAVITRHGFEINDVPVVKNANYATVLLGGAFLFQPGKNWEFQLSSAWSPAHEKAKQPYSLFLGAGFNYYLRPIPEERAKRNGSSGYILPKQFVQFGYSTNGPGYGVNVFVSKKASIFWGGEAQVKQGFTLSYQRNIFHARRVFAFDWTLHTGYWKSRLEGNGFFTASLNPVLRFTAFRSKPMDIFFEYSAAGPSFISRTRIDSISTGKKFTFHDFMGMGAFIGKNRNVYAGIRIAHYSNGNLFPQNDGVMIPLTFSLGYSIK